MLAGDETAYRMFCATYIDRLSRYLIVVAAGDEDAMREALQGTLKRVVRHLRVFVEEPVFWSWLTVLARSAYADERRKRRRYLSFLDRFARHAEIEREAQGTAESEHLSELLAASIASLPEEERQLLDWKYAERRSVRKVAEQLGMTEKAVESRLSRIRLKLKAAIITQLKHESPH
jgi:RNA polymerase sigma-70 factor (ECF subfamily)